MGNSGWGSLAGTLAIFAVLPCCASTHSATGADSALIVARMQSAGAMAELLPVPRPGRIETDADGSAWLALGTDGPRLLPWTGVPDGLECGVLPEEGAKTWLFRGPDAVALTLAAESMTLWAVDHARQCVVGWEPVEPAEPMGDPVAALSVHVPYLLDGQADPPEVTSEQELARSLGAETLSLTSDGFAITADDGTVLFSYSLEDPEPYGGFRDLALAVEREASGRLLLKLDVETVEDTEEAGGAHTRNDVLAWSGGAEEQPRVLSSQHEWRSSVAPLGCGESVTEEGSETVMRSSLPSGELVHEGTRSATETSTEVCVDGDPLCSVTTSGESVTWSWILELGDGQSVELGADVVETSVGDSTCGQ